MSGDSTFPLFDREQLRLDTPSPTPDYHVQVGFIDEHPALKPLTELCARLAFARHVSRNIFAPLGLREIDRPKQR